MKKFKLRAGILTRKFADRQGKIDGRMNIPSETWEESEIPFLIDLNHETRKKIESIEIQKMREEEQSESREVKIKAALKSKELESELVISSLKNASQDLNEALRLERVDKGVL